MPKRKLMLTLGYSGVGMLGLLTLAMLFPVTQRESFAACTPDSSTSECVAMPMSTEVGVTTSTVISLALDNQVQMEVVPKANGATSFATTRLSVSTNSNDGYAIYLQTGSESGSLTGVTTNLDGEIRNTIKQNVVLDSLENNSYGYALSKTAVDSNTTYSHVPTTSTIVESTTSSAASGGEYAYGDTYYLAFGAKVGTNLPAGQYAGTVTVSAVANPTTLRSMYDLTYMQDMTADICSNTKEHYTKQLVDSRDGKSYWVAKLKDGNCWMTQNLALDITEAGLSASDTDITEDWNQSSTYPPRNANRIVFNGTTVMPSPSSSGTDYWDFGDIVMGVPRWGTCNGENTLTMDDDIMEKCARVGFVNVSNEEKWSPTFTAQIGQYINPTGYEFKDAFVAVDCTEKDEQGFCSAGSYDAHYLMGNYYQYNAATAGTGGNMTSTNEEGINAASSVCPKNWKLPTSGVNNYNTNGSWGYLLRQYGYTTGDNTGTSAITVDDVVIARVYERPLYIIRVGQIQLDFKYLRRLGYDFVLTTSTVGESSRNRFLLYDTGSTGKLNAMTQDARQNGVPVRCLAR